jgi:hypothetical protein
MNCSVPEEIDINPKQQEYRIQSGNLKAGCWEDFESMAVKESQRNLEEMVQNGKHKRDDDSEGTDQNKGLFKKVQCMVTIVQITLAIFEHRQVKW